MQDSFRPKFSRIYRGDWPYARWDGVGIEFSGVPTDPESFIEKVAGFGCNLPAALRLLEALRADGVKRTTLSSAVPFDDVAEHLRTLGVTMAVIPPAKPSNQDIDITVCARLLGQQERLKLTREELQVVQERVGATKQAMAGLDFGVAHLL